MAVLQGSGWYGLCREESLFTVADDHDSLLHEVLLLVRHVDPTHRWFRWAHRVLIGAGSEDGSLHMVY